MSKTAQMTEVSHNASNVLDAFLLPHQQRELVLVRLASSLRIWEYHLPPCRFYFHAAVAVPENMARPQNGVYDSYLGETQPRYQLPSRSCLLLHDANVFGPQNLRGYWMHQEYERGRAGVIDEMCLGLIDRIRAMQNTLKSRTRTSPTTRQRPTDLINMRWLCRS
jgi:hypothetical protein